MKLGLARRPGIKGDPTEGLWCQPDLLAQWMSLTGRMKPLLFRRHTGPRPVVYLESDGAPYRDILAGQWDERLRQLRRHIPADAIIRWDHEMNAPPNRWRTWGRVDPALYIDVWQHVAGILGPMFWCPQGMGKDNLRRLKSYYPGDSYVDFIGFDRYDKGTRRRMRAQFKRPLRMVRELAPGKRVLIGETSSLRIRGVPGRARFIRSAEELEDDVWGLIGFDLRMPNERNAATGEMGRDYRFGSGMRREFRELLR